MTLNRKVKEVNSAVLKAKKLFKDKQVHVTSAERRVKMIQNEINVLKKAIEKDNNT